MNHRAFFTLFSLIFFGALGRSESICKLESKNSSEMKYEFSCAGKQVKINCVRKEKRYCEMYILDQFRSYNVAVSEEDIEELNLFDKKIQAKATCKLDASSCETERDICQKYKGAFNASLKVMEQTIASTNSCKLNSFGAVGNLGKFSTQFVEKNEFSAEYCKKFSYSEINALKIKISIFQDNLNLPLSSDENFFKRCLVIDDWKNGKPDFLLKNANKFSEIRGSIFEKVQNLNKVKDFVCGEDANKMFKDRVLNIDNLICVLTEEAKISANASGINFGCESTVNSELHDDEKSGASREASATTARGLAPAIEQPLPTALKKAIEEPLGLGSALAKVDLIAPDSTPSEGPIASGAVRSSFSPAIAQAAGDAFAPVFKRINDITAATSGLTGGAIRNVAVIGRTNIAPTTASRISDSNKSMVVPTVAYRSALSKNVAEQKVPVVAAATINQVARSVTSSKLKTTESEPVDPSLSGHRLGSSGNTEAGSSGNSALPPQKAVAFSEVKYRAVTQITNRVNKMTTAKEIKTFFAKEAASIPNFRDVLYTEPIKTLFRNKKIRVEGQNGEASVSGADDSKAKYKFSDTQTSFIPIRIEGDK